MWSRQVYEVDIGEAQLTSLLSYLNEMIALHGCDNTLGHAEAWARAHNVSWARLSRSLRSLGGFCDCEIALNAVGQERCDEDDS